MKKRILVIEDDAALARVLRDNLGFDGFDVQCVGSGASALNALKSFTPDLVVLDLMLPDANGFDLFGTLRQGGGTPIIILTARGQKVDKLRGLNLGADDYVTKPFSPRELIARIRAVLRRGRPADAKEKKASLKVGDLEIDRYRFEVRMKGRQVELTPKEFELLATLVGTPGRVFGREELLDMVWGRDGFVEPRTVDVHVARLRGKFSAAKLEEPGIETVRGVGYRFKDKP